MKDSTIKVCHIANTDIAVRFLLLNQLNFLKSKGYKVCAVCSQGDLIKDIEKQGIEVKIINFNRGINLFIHLISFLKLFFYFRKEKFDIVHTHTPVPGLLGQIAAKMTNVPIIVNTIHGFYFQEKDSWLKRTPFVLIEKVAAKCSDLIFSVSQGIIDTAIKERICKSSLLHYLGRDIDTNRFNVQRFSREFINKKKKELNIGLDLKIIGAVGRMVKEKGYLELFEAFKTVVERFPKTLLLVVGPEETKKRDKIDSKIVKKFGIEKKVLFLGQRIDVDELYSIMDVFVLPSHREGIGASVLEASAFGKSVIATDIQGCQEAVDNQETGILVPVRNSEKLSQAIIYLLENPEKAIEMGMAGREKIKREFAEDIVFDRMDKEYSRLIKEKLK